MEAIVDLIELAELKQQSIRKSFDEAHSQASSILSLTLHLKDFEDQFESAKDSLLKQAQELDSQAKKIAETAQVLDKRDQEVEVKLKEVKETLDNLQSKDYQLVLVQKWIRERSLDLASVEKQLNLSRKEVEDCNGIFFVKRGELELVQREHNAKREQLDTIEKSIEEYSGKLKLDETRLGLVKVELEECCKNLYVKNVELASVDELLEVRSTELEVKEKALESVTILATNCDEQLELKQKELSVIKNLISDCDGELELKRTQLRRLQKWTEKYSSELDLKVRTLGETEKSIDHCQNELESVKLLCKDYAEELEAKEKLYRAINNSINKCLTELSMKQKELESLDNSITEKSSEFGLQKKKLEELIEKIKSELKRFSSLRDKIKTNCEGLELKMNVVQESIRERNEELASKENLLKSVQKSIVESTHELESMKKQEDVLKISVTECSEELESKKKSLDLVERSLKECCDELTSKEAKLESLQRTICGSHKELEEREELDSLKTTLEQRSEKLQIKERELEAWVKELELREKKINLMQKSIEDRSKQLELKEKQLNDNFHGQTMSIYPENLIANHTAKSLSVDYQCSITDGRSLQLILNENLREYDSILNEVFTVIQKSSNPGKLVLDAIQGFHPEGLKNGDKEFSLSVIRRSCTTLIGQLLKISPQVKPEVREEAMKLALDWKSRMKALPENSQEVLAYLQLLAAFELGSSFSRDELRSFLGIIYQNKQALELQQAFGFAESLTVSKISSPPQTDKQNPLQAQKTETSLTADVQSGATICDVACPLILDDDMDNDELMPSEVLAALKLSPDPAKFVLDVLQGSYSQHCKHGGSGLDTGFAKSIVILLGQLINVSPKINPVMKNEAIKLAVLWKRNVTLETVKEMEVWAFLLFLYAYRLVPYFRGEEILRLVVKIASHRNSPVMCHLLGFADKIPELIQILVQNNQHIEAARFSCAFGLVHNFPLDILLEKCVEHLREDVREKAAEKELNARKAIYGCITDYNLKSRYDTEDIIRHISELEKQRTNSTSSSSAPAGFLSSENHVAVFDNQPSPLVQRRLHNENSRNVQSNNNIVQWQLHNQNSGDGLSSRANNKRPRIDISVDRIFSS